MGETDSKQIEEKLCDNLRKKVHKRKSPVQRIKPEDCAEKNVIYIVITLKEKDKYNPDTFFWDITEVSKDAYEVNYASSLPRCAQFVVQSYIKKKNSEYRLIEPKIVDAEFDDQLISIMRKRYT